MHCSSVKITVIVPCYNEQESLPDFLDETLAVLSSLDVSYELLFIDDGSIDNTPNIILEAVKKNRQLRAIIFSRNFGKEAAITAGLDCATGDAVIIMDADLQHPPDMIPVLIEKWRKHKVEMVVPCNTARESQSFLLKFISRTFYRVFRKITGLRIPNSGSDFRLMDRKVVEAIRLLPERNRFMKAIYAWPGFNVLPLEYTVRPRVFGTTKWSFWKRWNFALDGIFGYSSSLLKIWTYIGAVIASGSLLYAFYLGVEGLIYGSNVVHGVLTVAVLLLFFNGLLLINNGIMGEYIARIYDEVKHRPIYCVKTDTGNGNDKEPDEMNRGRAPVSQQGHPDNDSGKVSPYVDDR